MTLCRAVVLGIAAGSIAASGCDVPTDIPIVEQRWILPVKSTSISVIELFSSGVTLSGNAFSVTVPPLATSQSLGQICGSACAALNGLTVPVPPFSTSLTTTSSLPGNVAGATIASGSAQIAVQNGFSFDPVQGGGTVVVTVTDGPGGRELGRVQIGGAAGGSLPAGQTTTRPLAVAPGSIGSTITATTVITSNGGQTTRVDTNQRVTVTATPQSLLVSSARVNVANEQVTLSSQTLDVGDLDTDVTNHIVEGAIVLDVTNPFAVGIAGSLQIRYPGGTITKPIAIGAGAASTVRIALNGDELRSFMGKSPVTLTGTGTVAGNAGAITVTPAQQVTLRAKVDLTITVG